jgi:fatty-acyl-CoA synthase
VPAVIRWVLPWALSGGSSRNANPARWLIRSAERFPERIAIRTSTDEVSFGELVAQTKALAAHLRSKGVIAGQRVAIVEVTGIDLVRKLFACWWLGTTPALFDENAPESLRSDHLKALRPEWIWVANELSPFETSSVDSCSIVPHSVEGAKSNDALQTSSYTPMSSYTTGLILPTSGTEGYAKLCKISLGRLVLAGHAFGGVLLQLRSFDVIYCPLPLTHATGVMVGLLPAIVHGNTVYLAKRFSATQFTDDVERSGATHLVYVGEMLRFVLAATSTSRARLANVRTLVGNGLDVATWTRFEERFGRKRIVEFYGATELPAIVVNISGKPGAMGRVPLRHCSRFRVVKTNADSDDKTRRSPDIEIRHECAPGELGELVVRMPKRRGLLLGAFEGYWENAHEARAMLTQKSDARSQYYRTGDWVYYDENDFFYFVDRIGDVWRSRGYNVSTSWVAEQLRQCSCVCDCMVTTVALDYSPRRLALAVVVPDESFSVATLSACIERLPNYSRPSFVCLSKTLEHTSSFKIKRDAYRDGVFTPSVIREPLYLWDEKFVPFDEQRWSSFRERLCSFIAKEPASKDSS